MTIPSERSDAVLRTRNLLIELAYGTGWRDEEALRRCVRSLLKHYPDAHHIALSAHCLPDVWGEPGGGDSRLRLFPTMYPLHRRR
ncbi:BPSL0761 family protein [Trinickia mobilis]|uniref:BPSL0761 family protein n=1 Tax=Trinickia mobilis TaxID=2816356 RepID=UPI0025A3EE28|nr:BPSL0761 family protein [Trinickia mobilis]